MRRVECLQIQCNHVQSKYHCIYHISGLSISYTHMTEAHPNEGHWILQDDTAVVRAVLLFVYKQVL